MSKTREPDILEVISDLSNDEIFTPPAIANAVLDLLPEEVWGNPDLRWLDPGSKTGVFLREAARRLLQGLDDVIPDENERLEHILKRMMHGIAITDLTGLISRRSLYLSKEASGPRAAVAMPSPLGHIWMQRSEHNYSEGRCKECGAAEAAMERAGRENHAYAFIHESGREAVKELFEMKFDVIVGNPPYQMESDGGTRSMPLYNLFVEQAWSLQPAYVAMITQSRWMAGGLGLADFRAKMLRDGRVRKLVDYPDSSEVFPGVDIKGGVCYFLWDRDNPGTCEMTSIRGALTVGPVERDLGEFDVLVRDARALGILRKILDYSEESFSTVVRSKRPFGLMTNFREFSKARKPGFIRLYRSNEHAWVDRFKITVNTQWIDSWKVLIPKAGPGNSGGHVIPDMVLGQPLVAEPASCATETFIVVGPTKSREEAESIASYMRTRFFRFLVSLRKVSQDAPKGTYAWVPMQAWERTWTDEILFAKYGITAEEQIYIAQMVKEMST